MSEEFDFGFSTGPEIDDVSADYQREIRRSRELYDAIIPLLDNLAKDADKNPVINWPDRAKKIKEFRDKLDKILAAK